MGFSQILFTLIVLPQSLHLIKVAPAIFPLRMYMSQAYASKASISEGIGTATSDFGIWSNLSLQPLTGIAFLRCLGIALRDIAAKVKYQTVCIPSFEYTNQTFPAFEHV